jgi:hypothetical protein
MMRICLLIAVLFPPAVGALTQRCEIDGVRVTIYAPDWTWQRQNVNVLVVAENNADAARSIALELLAPAGKADDFTFNGATSIDLEMGVGETLRKAITDVYAKDGVPRQVYDFAFAVRGPNNSLRVAYPLRTVRGAAVTSAQSALYLPVIVALVWSVLFALVLPRLSSRGAWRHTQPAVLPNGDAAHE